MNKFVVACLGLMLSATTATAQVSTQQKLTDAYLSEAGDHAALFYAPIEDPIMAARWANHPFWESEDITIGNVSFSGILYNDVAMRYNVVTQQLVVATPQARILVTPNMEKLDWFTLFGKRFEKRGETFCCLEFDENGIKMWHKQVKRRGQDRIKDNLVYLSYDVFDSFIINDGKQEFEIKKTKELTKYYPEKKKAIRRLIGSSGYSKYYTLQQLVYVLKYLNSTK